MTDNPRVLSMEEVQELRYGLRERVAEAIAASPVGPKPVAPSQVKTWLDHDDLRTAADAALKEIDIPALIATIEAQNEAVQILTKLVHARRYLAGMPISPKHELWDAAEAFVIALEQTNDG